MARQLSVETYDDEFDGKITESDTITDDFKVGQETPDILSQVTVGQSGGSSFSLSKLAIPIGVGLGLLFAFILRKSK